MRGALILIVIVMGCAETETEGPGKSPEPNRAPVNPPKPADAGVATVETTVAVAGFKGEELDECVTMKSRAHVPWDARKRVEEEVGESFEELRESANDDRLVLEGACRDHFGDRPELATCEMEPETHSPETEIEIRSESWAIYYRLATSHRSDRYMRECLEMGGEWDAIERGSQEYREARLGESSDRARGLLEDL